MSGAGAGIGAARALAMAREGALVLGVAIDVAAVEAIAQAAGVTPFGADLTQEDDAPRVVAAALRELGGVDILVNAAAAAEFRWIEEMDYHAHWRRTLTAELDSVFLMYRAACWR